MTKHFAIHLLLTLCIVLLIASCSHRPIAFEYKSTPTDGWELGDTLKFHIDTLQHSGTYGLSLGLRTSASQPYPFQSIWVVVRQHWHNPEKLLIDTLECRLTNSKGDVIGNGVSLYSFTYPLKQMQLSQGTSADISIIHIMRREIINGIVDVGVRLQRER